MQQGNAPLKFQEVIRLTSFGIDTKCFKFGVTNFESDKYISIKDIVGDGKLTVIEVDNNFKYTQKPNRAEGVLMHPQQNIIALKAKTESGVGSLIQIFNMDSKQKLKSVEIGENIVFWKWATINKLALVTSNSVYYLNISNPNENQVKMMDRSGPLADGSTQIIGYHTDPQERWATLYGISTPDQGKTINGHIQLFLFEGSKQQLLDGHCCCFGEAFIHNDNHKSILFCFAEKKPGENISKIHINEISPPPANINKHKKFSEIQYAPDFPNDFPIYMQISAKYGILIIITKFGFLYYYELTTVSLIFRTRISQETIFIGAKNSKTDGAFAITKGGALLSINFDDNNLINYILNQCTHIPNNGQIAFLIASRANLPGVDNMFLDQFNRSLIGGDYAGAAKIAAGAPGTLLRNQETINKFKNLQPQSGQPQPILIYFQTLLEKGKLNAMESVEICKPVLGQGKKNYVEKWLQEDKLVCSEELGDMAKQIDINLAITIYEKGKCEEKLSQCYMETGQIDKVMSISSTTGAKADYISMLRVMIPANPEGALTTAKNICLKDPSVNVHSIAEIFLQNQRIQELTAFLVECMKGNKNEDGKWQTKVLELNLMAAPHVAEAILQMEIWNQFNRQQIALLCEQKGNLQRALENFSDIKDIKRVILNTHMINKDWLVAFISKLPSADILSCVAEMLRHNRQNLNLVVQIATKNQNKLDLLATLKVFETIGAFDGIFYFLGGIVNSTTDKEIHYKYIEAAAKCNQLREIERIITEKKDCYEPVKVKDLLKELKLGDPKPLIFLCDIHGYIEELTKYLYKHNFNKFIEIYLFKVNAKSTHIVLGTLIDLECDENYIKQILYTMRGNCPIEPLIEEFDKRNKLRAIENWLDSRVTEGNQIPEVHNALAKIKIDTNQNPQDFLINNQFYDSKVVGKYCEERDPHLAYTAYKRAWGQCDTELIEVTNKNALYRLQARYLVERQSKELWTQVLTPDNPHRKAIIEHIVSHALPDSKNVDEVSITVQAFMAADLPNELISLLEKIVLHNSEFGQYKKLQNLLIITAIKADKTRVMDYIKRLDNYDGKQIADIALGEQYQLYEEAFVIYEKQQFYVEAIDVLINNIESIVRAAEFAEKINQNDVWSRLAPYYLDKFQITEAIDCYLKAGDSMNFVSVISSAENEGFYEPLIKYLLMCREQNKNQIIDNSLCYCYAKTDKLNDLEELVNNPNSTDIQRVGERCYDEKLYHAAKILFVSIKNNAKIASCLVRLKEFNKAIEAAKKANTPRTWKELCIACVEAQEYKLASVAGMNIIIHPDHLEDLIHHYEENEVADEMIAMLQSGMTLDRTNIGIFTELGILYAKYQPEKLMEHCKQYFQKLNIAKLLRACERYLHWSEAVYLYSHYDEYDNAINIMIEHSPTAWSHDLFVNLIQKVANYDLFYKSMLFYLEEEPERINDFLKSLSSKIDLTKAVSVMKRSGYISLIAPFLKHVQNTNNQAVNEALNEIYLEEGDHESLLKSIKTYENFEPMILAKATENHEIVEFRRVAAYLYRRTGKYDKSIVLSKKDEMYRDAIETALESGNKELAEDLLKFFVLNNKEFFTVCLYTCYELISPETALELSWRFGLMDYSMPYFIQIIKELTTRVETVQKKHDDHEKKAKKEADQLKNKPLDYIGGIMMPGLNSNMIMPGPEQMGVNMDMNMNMNPMNNPYMSVNPMGINPVMNPSMNPAMNSMNMNPQMGYPK